MSKRSKEWDDFSKRMSAYGMGIASAPFDLVKYAGLGANEVAEWTGLRTPEESKQAAAAIRHTMDNLPFLPESVNNYRNWLRNENPEMSSLGEVAGGVLTGKAVVNNPYLLQKGNKVVRALSAYPIAPLAGFSSLKEWVIEPKIDKAANNE